MSDPANISAALPAPATAHFRLRQHIARFRGSHHSRILSGSLIMLISSAVVVIVNFAYNVMVAQHLGPAEFGHVATAVSLLLMASALTLSFQIVCAKFVARARDDGERAAVYRRLRLRAWQASAVLGAVLLAAAVPVTNFLHFPTPWIMVLLAIGVAFYVPLGVKRGIFQGTCSFPRLATNYSLEALTKFGIAAALIWAYGALGAVIALMFSVIMAYFLPRPQRMFRNGGALAEPIHPGEGRQAIIFFVGQVIITNTDLIMVKHFFPPAEAGQYAAVALVGRVLFYASWAVISAMFPVSAEGTQSESSSRSMVAVPMAMVLGLFLSFLGLLALFPALVMRTIFGPGFGQAEPLLGLYAANTAVYALAVVLMAYEMSRKVANTGWLQMVFSGLVVLGVSLFHNSLREVITVLLVLMVTLLLVVALPFFRPRGGQTSSQLQEAA